MLKEHTTVNYACRIAGILNNGGPIPAGEIAQLLGGSPTYVPKVLSRLTQAGLLRSGVDGYELAQPLAQLTVADVLRVCHTPMDPGPASRATDKLLELAAAVPLQDVL